MHQAGLPSVHTPLTEVSIPHFDLSVPMVSSWLFPFSFLRELSFLLIFWDNLLVFRSYNMGSFSTPQKGSIFYQYLILKLLEILHLFYFILLLHKPPLLNFLPYLGLYCLLYLLSSMLNMVGFCHLFQIDQKLLSLLMSSLYLLSLLF